MSAMFSRITESSDRQPGALLLLRIMVGGVFLLEGMLKFISPDKLGVGRFAKIGFPSPEIIAPFLGVVEIVCGVLLITGLLVRLGAIPLIIDMLVAIATTKIPILTSSGFWNMAHEARVDFMMLAGSVMIFVAGAGPVSLDARLALGKEAGDSLRTILGSE